MPDLQLQNLDELAESLPNLDPSNPLHDRYYDGLRDLQRAIRHQKAVMPNKHAEQVRLHVDGLTHTEVGNRLKCSPVTVSRTLKTPHGRRLRNLLYAYRQHEDGPTHNHRVAILYRIALDNEQKRPGTAITAIGEINRMQHTQEERHSLNGSNVLNITINGVDLPKTQLDSPTPPPPPPPQPIDAEFTEISPTPPNADA